MKKNIFYGLAGLVLGFVIALLTTGYFIKPPAVNNMEQPMNMDMSHGSSMQGEMDNMLAGLKGKTGAEFDKAFLSEMIIHHQGAVEMAKLVLQNSKQPELINFANSIITVQSKEIEQMKAWQKSW